MPCCAEQLGSPMPDSWSSLGDSMAPLATTTSCRARTVWVPGSTRLTGMSRPGDWGSAATDEAYSTPTQRPPSKSSRVACALVRRVTFGRSSTGSR